MDEMNRDLLSMMESKALRGVAILGIILHNYCHFLGFAVKENEYQFDAERPKRFWEVLTTFDHDLFVHLFSFLGHYGVPIFLFVSGFGLVMKYENRSGSDSGKLPALRKSWFVYHFLKLLRLMILGYIVFIAVYVSRHPADAAAAFSVDKVIAQLTMVINFVFTRPDKAILPGPYWFFGLMIQLYLLYQLVFYRWRNVATVVVAIVLCWLIQVFAAQWNPFDFNLLNYVRYNFIGGVMPFGAGILYARHGRQISKVGYCAVLIISAIVVLEGGMWFHSWMWVPLFVITGAVATVKLLPSWLLSPAAWFGALSSALFVMHPVVREVVISHYRSIDVYYGIAVYLLAAVALSMLLQYVLKYIPSPKQKK